MCTDTLPSYVWLNNAVQRQTAHGIPPHDQYTRLYLEPGLHAFIVESYNSCSREKYNAIKRHDQENDMKSKYNTCECSCCCTAKRQDELRGCIDYGHDATMPSKVSYLSIDLVVVWGGCYSGYC